MTSTGTNRLTLGRLARATGLARSSLIHYEALGLLLPAVRSEAGYRMYGEAQIERLHAIRRFRDAGLSLAEIGKLFTAQAAGATNAQGSPATLLVNRLMALGEEVDILRSKQKMLARLLAAAQFHDGQAGQGKAAWVALLRHAGFDDNDMRNWHGEFEADNPDQHAAFLASLGLAPDEVAAIRQWSLGRR